MTRAVRDVALVAAAVLLGAACTSSLSGSTSGTSPSAQANASAGASASASTSPSSASPSASTPAASPTPSPAPVALTITSMPLHIGEAGVAYGAVALGAAGGIPPYRWSVTAGALPNGLSLSSAGVIGGTPAAAGTPSFTVTVSDSAGRSASKAGSINVVSHLQVSAPCADLCSVEAGCTICGAFGTATGGVGPLRVAVVQGAPPPGMGLNGLSLTGAFPGGGAAQYLLDVVVTDQLGVSGLVNANWYVFAHITLSGGSINCFWTGCSVQFPYSNGTPNGAISASVVISSYSQTCLAGANCPPPPHVVSAKAGGGVLTITVTLGPPNAAWSSNGWTGTLTVVLTDQSPCGPGNCNTGQVKFSITVQAG